jgi:hypothetical protein
MIDEKSFLQAASRHIGAALICKKKRFEGIPVELIKTHLGKHPPFVPPPTDPYISNTDLFFRTAKS